MNCPFKNAAVINSLDFCFCIFSAEDWRMGGGVKDQSSGLHHETEGPLQRPAAPLSVERVERVEKRKLAI